MSIVIIVAVLLAVFHFVYESILAPSFRLEIRFELFKLRDELRELKIAHGKELEGKHFSYLQDSLNNMILNLPRIDMATVISATMAMQNDKEFKERVELRTKIMEDCKLPEAKAIRKKHVRLFARTIAVNNGAWTVLLVLPALATYTWSGLRKSVRTAASMSEGEFEKVSPSTCAAVA